MAQPEPHSSSSGPCRDAASRTPTHVLTNSARSRAAAPPDGFDPANGIGAATLTIHSRIMTAKAVTAYCRSFADLGAALNPRTTTMVYGARPRHAQTNGGPDRTGTRLSIAAASHNRLACPLVDTDALSWPRRVRLTPNPEPFQRRPAACSPA